MNNLDLFVKTRVEELEENKDIVINFYKKLGDSMPQNKPISEYNREDFVEIISNFNTFTTNTFVKTKSNIHSYFEWLMSRGEMSEEQLKIFSDIHFKDFNVTDSYSLYYFKDFNELYTSLEEAIKFRTEDDDDEGEFDTLRAIDYLSWYGFTLEDLTNVLKKDIDRDRPIVYRGKNRISITVDEKCIEFLRAYAGTNTFMSRRYGRGKSEVSYRRTEYLIRTDRSEQLNSAAIRAISSRINADSDEIGKVFTIKKIFLSGMYSRAYLDELENGELSKTDNARLIKLFDSDNSQSKDKLSPSDKNKVKNFRFNEYEKFKSVFYSGQPEK